MKEGKLVVNSKYRRTQWMLRGLDLTAQVLMLLGILFGGKVAVFLEQSESRAAWQTFFWAAGFAMVSLILGKISEMVGEAMCAQVEDELQNAAYRQILEGDWKTVNRIRQGDAEQRIQRDAGITAMAVTEMRRKIGKAAAGICGMPVLLLFYDQMAAGVFSVEILSSALLFWILYRKNYKAAAKWKEMESQATAFYRDSVDKLSVIQTYQAGGMFERQQSELMRRQKRYRKRAKQYRDGIEGGLLILGLATSAAFLARAGEWLRGGSQVENSVVYLLLIGFLIGNLVPLKGMLGRKAESMVSAGRLAEMLELPEEGRLDEEWVELLEMRQKEGFAVRFHQVDFSYRKGKPVLEQVTLEALPEEWVGIGGFSGAGKTTAVRLLLGQVFPDAGEVDLIHRQGLTCLVSAASREFFAWVPQESSLFPGTIAANLRLGKADAKEEEMWQALGIVCLDSFVRRQPEGLNTMLGGQGLCLSAGQAQQLAIARAVLKDAPICVLDEPTAAMDAETEESVLANLYQVWQEKTCILTSHDSQVLAWCDRTYWIAGGEVRPVQPVLEETAAADLWEDVEEEHLPEVFS